MGTNSYIIKATPTQVRELCFASNQAMRIHIGQLTDPLTVYLNFINAYQRHHEGQQCPTDVEDILDSLSRLCWVHTPNGYAYSEKAGMLWRLYRLFRNNLGDSLASGFTVSRPELIQLSNALEQASLLRVGQIVESMLDELLSAYRRSHEKDTRGSQLTHQIRRALSFELEKLHEICWNMSPTASYGLGYDSESDSWWSMYEVIRHQLWKEEHPFPTSSDRLSVASYPPMALGDEPLLKVVPL